MIKYKKKRIALAFRYDDYSGCSPTDAEVRLIELFRKYAVPCTFGVIPYVCAGDFEDIRPQDVLPLTPLKIDILKDAVKQGVLEIAQHGFSHQTIREKECGHTEFSGLDYDSQLKKISGGKDCLENTLDVQITTFIPPWNSYDMNTVRVLEELGFQTISADGRGIIKKRSPLKFRPERCGPNDIPEKVESARHFWKRRPVVIPLFHAFEFSEVNGQKGNLTYQRFDNLLAWISSQKDICAQAINQL